MQLQKLLLKLHYYLMNKELELKDGINIIYGLNGMGKTNIIEAIYYFQSGKSFRCVRENEIIKFGKSFSKIEAEFVLECCKDYNISYPIIYDFEYFGEILNIVYNVEAR